MRFRSLAVLAGATFAALLAGCAEGPYYGGPYYSSGYDYGYYGPGYYSGYSYYDYGPSYYYSPGYLGFSYRSGDGDRHWDHSNWSSRSFQQGSVQTQPRTSSRIASKPRVRSSSTSVAHAGRHIETHTNAARQPPRHLASQTRTGPDREHGG